MSEAQSRERREVRQGQGHGLTMRGKRVIDLRSRQSNVLGVHARAKKTGSRTELVRRSLMKSGCAGKCHHRP